MQRQTKITTDTNLTNQDSKVEKLIKNPISILFFYDLQIVSFLIANIAITIILNHFFQLAFTTYVIVVIVGTIMSLVIIKTHYFLDLNSVKERLSNFIQFSLKKPRFKDIQMPSVSFYEIIGFTLRNIFFNLLNDSFIVLIYWIFAFTLLIWIRITNLPDPITDFAETIALIGIVSGLFQIYIKDYKENSANMIKSIIEEKLNIIRSISLKDYQIFLIQKNNCSGMSVSHRIEHRSGVS